VGFIVDCKQIKQVLTEATELGAYGTIAGGAAGLLLGKVFGPSPVLAAKVYAAILGLTGFTSIMIGDSNKKYGLRIVFTVMAIDSVIAVFALRHFNIIGKTGTVVAGLVSTVVSLLSVYAWVDNADENFTKYNVKADK
jgi:hypothetical protein